MARAKAVIQFERTAVIDAVKASGVAGLTTVEIAQQTAIPLRRAAFYAQLLQAEQHIELGERVGVDADRAPRWVTRGLWDDHRAYRKALQAELHAQQKAARLERAAEKAAEKAAAKPVMTYAEQQAKLMESASQFAEVWLAEDPEHRIVPAGQWRAEPVRVPVSVFQLGSV